MQPSPILVVDDDPDSLRYMELALRGHFPAVLTAPGGAQGFELLRSRGSRVVVSDLRMPEVDGIALLALTHEYFPGTAFLLVTVEDDVATAVEALKRGAFDYHVKPVPPDILVASIKRALSDGADPLREVAPEMIGGSAAMARLRRQIEEAARCDLNVLIGGETGTGKELTSRAIHARSRRCRGPFVAHNCAATPGDLFESLFFGHEKGAFTGAGSDQRGLLEEADSGTLLLDEMESLPPAHQGKLLRVMDDGVIRPVGSRSQKTVSVRFLATTNRDPERMISDGSLRTDLFYRVRGLEIAIPPLRSRAEDIPLIADRFLCSMGRSLDGEALSLLVDYPWPGNVRELRNVLAASCAHCPQRVLKGRDLLFSGTSYCWGGSRLRAADFAPSAGVSLRENERQAIVMALKAAAGQYGRAASLLGIHRATLRRKIREYGIPRTSPSHE
jgi:DNA-binding NtrC family response regulator